MVMEKKRRAKKRGKACWGERERGWSDFLGEKNIVFVVASL